MAACETRERGAPDERGQFLGSVSSNSTVTPCAAHASACVARAASARWSGSSPLAPAYRVRVRVRRARARARVRVRVRARDRVRVRVRVRVRGRARVRVQMSSS